MRPTQAMLSLLSAMGCGAEDEAPGPADLGGPEVAAADAPVVAAVEPPVARAGGAPATSERPDAPVAWLPPRPARNALVIVVDTTRADAIAAAATPNIDALAAAGASVPRAWASGTWTVPSVVSLMTGMSVRAHGFDLSTGRLGRYPRLPDAPTLAEVLQARGFTTHGLHANPYLSEALGFDRGFDTWKRTVDRAIPGQLADHVEQDWTADGRHFAYVHFIGPHSPVRPSPAAAARHAVDTTLVDPDKGMNIGVAKRDREGAARAAYRAAYHAVLEDTDARVGAAIEALGEHRADTLVILTSDHGELLGEHGRVGHGRHVWEALTHVPLIVDHPALPGPAESLPAALGNATVPDLVTRGLGVDHRWRVDLAHPLPLVSQREGRLAISTDGLRKASWDEDVSTDAQVFDLSVDPGEASPGPDTGGEMAAARAAFEARTPAGRVGDATVQLHPDTVQQLQALGYVP
jgi:arylsulfatase A-like enzyme